MSDMREISDFEREKYLWGRFTVECQLVGIDLGCREDWEDWWDFWVRAIIAKENSDAESTEI